MIQVPIELSIYAGMSFSKWIQLINIIICISALSNASEKNIIAIKLFVVY